MISIMHSRIFFIVLLTFIPINGMNLGASPEPRSAARDGELYTTFSSAVVEREGGLNAAAQSINFYSLNHTHGLSNNVVYDIVQDEDGFMWFATECGLNRYDGNRFITYLHSPNNAKSLSENRVLTLLKTKNGRLWAGTNGEGINVWNKHTESFSHFVDSTYPSQMYTNNCIWDMAENANGNIWAGTFGAGLKLFDVTIHQFKTWNKSNSLIPSNDIRKLAVDNNGILWLGTFEEGLVSYNIKSSQFVTYKITSQNGTKVSNQIMEMLPDFRSGKIWIGINGGEIYSFDIKSKSFTHISNPFGHAPIRTMIFDPYDSNRVWIGTYGGGIYQYHKIKNKWNRYSYEHNEIGELPDNKILCLYADSSGLIWGGTYGKGIIKYSTLNYDASKLIGKKELYLENAPTIYSIYEENPNNVWIGTYRDGLFHINPETGAVYRYHPEGKGQYQLNNSIIYTILPDNGFLWVGTAGGLFLLDKEKGVLQSHFHQSNNKQSISSNYVTSSLKTKNGELWFGTFGQGLNMYDKSKKKFIHYSANEHPSQSLSHGTISCLHEERNTIWIGTGGGGLNILDMNTGKISVYKNTPGESNSLSNNFVTSIEKDSNGAIWIGTLSGLDKVELDTEGKISFRTYFVKDGLLSDRVSGIIINKNELWISTGIGICNIKFDKNRNVRFRNVTALLGAQNIEFLNNAYYASANGQIYFGGTNGIIAFFPSRLKDDLSLSKVNITGFQIFNQEVRLDTTISKHNTDIYKHENNYYLSQDITYIPQIVLSYKESVFSFQISAMNYLYPENNYYAYKMEGLDNDWNYIEHRNNITFTHLPPGNYKLKIKAANYTELWDTQIKTLQVIITPPFWETIWFRALSSVVIFAMLIATIYYLSTLKYKRQLAALQKQKELQKERERISMDLHDNVGSQLSSIILGLDIAQKSYLQNKKEIFSDVLQELKNDAQVTMSQLKETIWAISSSEITLTDFANKIFRYAEQAISKNSKIKFFGECPTSQEVVLSANQIIHLFRIIQEAINNTLKHSNATEMHIKLEIIIGTLTITISDNGRGNKTEKQGHEFSGNGLLNMGKRTQDLQGTFKIDTTNGYAVIVNIPVM